MTELIDVDPDDHLGPGNVLAAAFHDDPTLRWCFGGDEPGFEERLHGYLEVGHTWHTDVGHPVHGIREGEVLAGVAYAILPDIQSSPQQVETLRASLVERCGQQWAARFAEYNQRVEAVQPKGRFHGIALVGVRPEWQGRGLGAQMVDRVLALCDADPRSDGVLLDTTTERNVRFYQARGFRQVAEVAFDGFVERVMLRPGSSAA